MIKKILAVILCLSLLILVGCSGDAANQSEKSSTPTVSEEPAPKLEQNPLTGLYELADGLQYNRPVAVMINNIFTAQKVQTGLNKADIVYETEVEGGITRLMAVYQNIAAVEQIGTIRSARYPYIDLAMGHNAFYVHHGTDGTYAKPHLKDADAIEVDQNVYGGRRISNGLAREHTLYALGPELYNGIGKKDYQMKNDTVDFWQNFTDEDEIVTPDGIAANNVTAKFSNSYKTNFTYDPATTLYTVGQRKDYLTGEGVEVKNVFVLYTSIVSYPDGYHKKVDLKSGEGYYITNGYAQEISWSKGDSEDGFVFTDSNGEQIKVNAGKSWVCIQSDRFNATIA